MAKKGKKAVKKRAKPVTKVRPAKKAKATKKAKPAAKKTPAAKALSVQWEQTQLRGPLTASRLAKFEKTIGIARLPNDYRAFLLEHNGGIAVRRALDMGSFHPDSPPGFMTECECFYPLHDLPTLGGPTGALKTSLEKVTTDWRKETADSANHIVIGRDPGGNLFCLAVAGPKAGAISFSCHETGRLYPVARSFSSCAR